MTVCDGKLKVITEERIISYTSPYVHMLLSETTRCLGERMTSASIHPCWNLTLYLIQSTPDNSNLQGKSKKVRVIGSLKEIAGSKGKTSFYSIVNSLITFNCRNVKLKWNEAFRI